MIIELYQAKRGGWRYRIRADNGKLYGHDYRDETDASRGALDLVAAIQAEILDHGHVTIRTVKR